jgi:hypothetical protein
MSVMREFRLLLLGYALVLSPVWVLLLVTLIIGLVQGRL